MSPPAAGSASAQSTWISSFVPGATQSGAESGPRVSDDAAPRVCTTCAAPLTVAERMFYFLEGTDAVPRCRSCLSRQELRQGLTAPSPRTLRPPAEDGARVQAPPGAARRAGLNEMVRTYIREELERIDSTLTRLGDGGAEVPVVRSLQEEALRELSDDRLPEAILWLGEIRHKLEGLDAPPERVAAPTPSPWDESVEEMYGRVSSRAKVLAVRRRAAANDSDTVPPVDPPAPLASR
jgi:hypothetical protein